MPANDNGPISLWPVTILLMLAVLGFVALLIFTQDDHQTNQREDPIHQVKDYLSKMPVKVNLKGQARRALIRDVCTKQRKVNALRDPNVPTTTTELQQHYC